MKCDGCGESKMKQVKWEPIFQANLCFMCYLLRERERQLNELRAKAK